VPLAPILNELVSNAVRFGSRANGGALVDVGLTASGGMAVLVVKDHGPGFTPDLTSRKRASGLGLVRTLVRRLGGTLHIDGSRGTRCTVVFSDRSLAAGADLRARSAGP